ncbi:MAG: hypothetical protein ACQKBU_04825 [Verrucomicrobiales bacterium]
MTTSLSRLLKLASILPVASSTFAQQGDIPQVSAAQQALETHSSGPHADAAAQANNPLADTKAVSFHNYYIGELTGVNDNANQFLVRYAQPFSIGQTDWLMRATLPFNTFPTTTGTQSGIGDFNIFASCLFDTGNPGVSVGLGPQLTLPTATDSALGSDQWSAGLAHVLFNATSKKFQYGYLMTWQGSFAGDDQKNDVNVGAFQPFLFLQLGDGWYLRSSGVMVYDFESDDYTIPLGLGFGKIIPSDTAVINAFVEPQYSLFDSGSSYPEWQIFTGLNFQF